MSLIFRSGEVTRAKQDPSWRDYSTEIRVLIDSIDNDEYQIALERHRRKVSARDRVAGSKNLDVLPDEESDYAAQCRLMGQFVVRGWQGAMDAKGQPVAYSAKAATATMLADPAFFVWVLQEAQAVAVEHLTEAQQTLGKPSPGTDGTESGAGGAKNVG